MLTTKPRQTCFALVCLSLFIFTAACSTNTTGSASPTHATSTPTPAQPTATPMVTTTDCPAPDTGRAAIMPPLQLGKDQNIVYLTSAANGGASGGGGELMALNRYDVQTGTTTTIKNLTAKTAQISQDGQWVLLTVLGDNISEIQLIRLDGKYLQTLYCAPAGQQVDPTTTTGMQWSPDQKQIIFAQGTSASSRQPFYLLNLTTGNVELELTLGPAASPFLPHTWLDNRRVYVNGLGQLFILDTSAGPNQHFSNLKSVMGFYDYFEDYDTSYDGSKLFVGSVFKGVPSEATHCVIAVISPDHANSIKSISCKKLSLGSLRVIGYGSSRLMFIVKAGDRNDGFWKINTDGTGLTQLDNKPAGFNKFTKYPWSNFSRDGSFYTDGPFFGSLSSGLLTRYALDGALLVGWTTM